jgi:multidrug resistance efflux pump
VLKRTDIRAPISDVVMNLHYFTTGGLIEPGAPVLDIVSQQEDLLVRAQVWP